MNVFKFILPIAVVVLTAGCNTSEEKNISPRIPSKQEKPRPEDARSFSQEFKEYWFSGEAEITSYQLTQERYGEMREGTAVTIYVTEDFLPDEQVKAERISEGNIPVLKLNLTKNFNTGIYPYSIMSSTFSPLSTTGHALKISNSTQEWCGQVYLQLNNREIFELETHSYFEGEADQKFSLPKNWLEDELWNLIRINPEELPTGEISIIPSLEYIRLHHKEIKEYHAFANIKQGDSMTVYTLNYPDLQRQLKLIFRSRFPFEIEKWEEVNGADRKDSLRLQTRGEKIHRIKSDYWNKNRNEFAHLRDSLGLK